MGPKGRSFSKEATPCSVIEICLNEMADENLKTDTNTEGGSNISPKESLKPMTIS